jgi:hypothetical protein
MAGVWRVLEIRGLHLSAANKHSTPPPVSLSIHTLCSLASPASTHIASLILWIRLRVYSLDDKNIIKEKDFHCSHSLSPLFVGSLFHSWTNKPLSYPHPSNCVCLLRNRLNNAIIDNTTRPSLSQKTINHAFEQHNTLNFTTNSSDIITVLSFSGFSEWALRIITTKKWGVGQLGASLVHMLF